MLLGRTLELKYLQGYYEQKESSLVVLYGQNGLGVSYLWKEFVKDKNVSILSAVTASERQQLYLWAKELRSQGISIDEYPDFSTLFFSLISQRVTDKKILVIENFQNMIRNSDSFMDELVLFYKQNYSENNLMIILQSNAISWVENTFVTTIGKNAFAISGFIKCKPLHFLDLVCFYDKAGTYDCIEYYSILGGFPAYWHTFKSNSTIKENIISSFLAFDAPYRKIGADIVLSELREANVYFTILSALAEGRQKLNEIYLHTGYSRAKISVYLKNLMALEIVEKVFSYETAGSGNAKKGVYRIVHPMVHFYFRFLYPHESSLCVMTPEAFYDAFIEDDIKKYVSDYFKLVCMEYLSILNERKMLPFTFTKSGEWVGKAGNIDIVAQNRNRDTILGLCNFDKPVMTYEDYEWFLFCAKEARLRPEFCYLFSVGGFDAKLLQESQEKSNLNLVDMNQL